MFWRYLCFYIGLLCFGGYIFGGSDHIDLLSYVRYLQDPQLYPHDFFVQHLAAHVPNERTALALALAATGPYLEWACLLLHAVASIALLAGLYRWANSLIQRPLWAWVALGLLFVPFSMVSLGGNQLYYNQLLGSNLAKAAGVWALWHISQGRPWRFVLCAVLATILQPVAGGQVFVLGAFAAFFSKKISFSKGFWPISCYAALMGPLALLLLQQYGATEVPPEKVFEIVQFRLAHHFIPSAFGWFNGAVLVPLLLFGLWYFRARHLFLFWLMLGVAIPAVVYVFLVEIGHNTACFASQWFKTTIWAKAFALFALVAALCERMGFGGGKSVFGHTTSIVSILNKKNVENTILAALACLLLALMSTHPNGLVGKRAYQFPWSNYRNTHPEIDIALQAKATTPPDAVFVQPASLTAFKFFSERSSLVDAKAIVHHQGGMVDWYARMWEVYGLDAAHRDPRLGMYAQGDSLFAQIREGDFLFLKDEGVTHVLTTVQHALGFPVVAQNGVYKICVISD
jgi:hypothetical protein